MPETLRIATFNLENLNDAPNAVPSLASRITVLRPQLESLNADILCLQEIDGQRSSARQPRTLAALNRLLEGTPYESYHRATTYSDKNPAHGARDKHNLVTLSRYPITASRQVLNSYVPAPSYPLQTAKPASEKASSLAWDRPILHTTVTLPNGQSCDVLNLHLRAPLAASVPGQKESAFVWKSVPAWAEGFFMATVKRAGQATEARMVVDEILDADPDALICVAGDCNAEEREMPLRILCADPDDTGNAAFAGRSLVALETHVPREQRFTVRHAGRFLMLDHLLASRPLARMLKDVDIQNTGLGDELVAHAAAHQSAESYHAPMVAAFRLL